MKIKEIQKLYLRSYLPQLFPAGVFKGDEFILGDAHGSKGRSFSFNVVKGIGRDFSADKNYNIVTLVAEFFNLSTKEAYKKILREWGLNNTAPAPAKTTPVYSPVIPVPRSAPALQISGNQGAPSFLWEYKNRLGELMFYVARFDDDNGKRYLPFTFDGKKWQAKGMPAPRPLYNLPAFRDDKNFILVEGEKAADALKTLCPWGIGTTWANGSQAINQTDWSALANKKIIIWRDNDDAGVKAQQKLCDVLAALGCEIRILADSFYAARPEKWDAADALNEGITPQELQDLLKANLLEYKSSQFGSSESMSLAAVEEKTTPNLNTPLPEPLNRYYKPLGLIGSYYAFYNYTSGLVITTAHNGLNEMFFLSLSNGDRDFWVNSYGYDDDEGVRRVNWKTVAGVFMGECNHIGQFDLDTVRGVGAWQDKKHIVINAGKWLYIDGKKTAIDKFESSFLYQKSNEIFNGITKPLTREQREDFLDICGMFAWEQPVSAKLLAGWLLLAPICGCLNWRPHIYICGMSGSGKSTIYKQILSRSLGKFKRAYLGDTTEAGVRQRGSNDSLPAIFDEFEIDNKQSAERIEKIIRLFRMCSDAHDGRLYKGSQDQSKAISYTVQSAACFSSITPSVKHFADISRITTLALKTEHGNEPKRAEKYENLRTCITNLMGDDNQDTAFSEAFISFAILNAHKVFKSHEAFKTAAPSTEGFTARIADQMGMLLAGWWTLTHDEPATVEQARDVLSNNLWEELIPTKGHQNQSQLIRKIAQYQFDVDNEDKQSPRKYGRAIGQLVEYVSCEDRDDFENGHYDRTYFTWDVAGRALMSKGIVYKDGMVYFANSCEALKKILHDTQWETDWRTTLKAIKGALVTTAPIYFGAAIGNQRATGVPVDVFLDLKASE